MTGNPVTPFTPESLGKVDLLLITHNAYDHFGDAPEILKRYKCPVIVAGLNVPVPYNRTLEDIVIPSEEKIKHAVLQMMDRG